MKRSYEVVWEEHDKDVPNLKNNTFSLEKKNPKEVYFYAFQKKKKKNDH